MGTDGDSGHDHRGDMSRDWTRAADENGQAFGGDPPTEVIVIRQRVIVIRNRTAAAGQIGIRAT